MYYFDLLLRPHPTPRKLERRPGFFSLPNPFTIRCDGLKPEAADSQAWWQLFAADVRHLLGRPPVLGSQSSIRLSLGTGLPAEGYSLNVAPDGIALIASDTAGLIYGLATLTQLIGIIRMSDRPGEMPAMFIIDFPHFPFRGWALDLGRAIFSRDSLEHAIRLSARLKLNILHLHLHDSEMNAVRYPGTPLGSENPFALDLDQWASLVEYARQHAVTLVPEVESWGHADSLLRHYPHLYGATRRHGYGHSLGIGPATLELLSQLYDAWMGILPDNALFHVGLDEGTWKRLAGADPVEFGRDRWVEHVHRTATAAAARHGKRVRLAMWHDTSQPLPVPPDLRQQMILMPWSYHIDGNPRRIEEIVRTNAMLPNAYVPDHKRPAPLVCISGASGTHEMGAFAATRRWMELVQRSPNVLGGMAGLWGSNDLAGRLLTIYAGAESFWSPNAFNEWYGALNHEDVTADVLLRMRAWQDFSPETQGDSLRRAYAPEVLHGRYRYGPRHWQNVVEPWEPAEVLRGNQE